MAAFIVQCPHCNTELQMQEEWIGLEISCPECSRVLTVNKPESDALPEESNSFIAQCPSCNALLQMQKSWIGKEIGCSVCQKTFVVEKSVQQQIPENHQEEKEQEFILICPECSTVVELPVSMKGKEYECPYCCETIIAAESLERDCPFCREKIKIKASVCKHCRKKIQPLQIRNKSFIYGNDLKEQVQQARGRLKKFEDDLIADVKAYFTKNAPVFSGERFKFLKDTKKRRLFIIGCVVATFALFSGSSFGIYYLIENHDSFISGSRTAGSSSSSGSRVSRSGTYASKISGIMSDYSYRDTMSKNIYQQICNGTYRTVELLDVIAQQNGCSTSSIMSDYSYRDTMSKNIYQQICNGTYRTVELLNLIAKKRGCSTSGIMSDYSYRDTMSKNIYQQICNGTYRTVELLNLIAKKNDE